MALARVTVWIDQQTLTHTALNGEFDNLINNPISLISPFTANVAAGGFDLTGLDEVGLDDAAADASAAGRLRRNGTVLTWHNGTAAGRLFFVGGADVPVADGGTGLSSGQSGGLLAFTGLATIASTATLSAGTVVVGMGSGTAPAGLALTDGQLIIGRTGASPSAATLTAGSNVNITSAAGAITIGASALTPIGTGYTVLGATASCATGTTVVSLSADYIQLFHPNTATASIWAAPATTSVDAGVVAGTTQAGRDQGGAFTAGSWVHAYWIGSGSAPVPILSANPPRGATATLSGPTLPTGFWNWAYHGTYRWNAGSAFDGMDQFGAMVTWRNCPLVLDAGSATSETAIAIGARVPPPNVAKRAIVTLEASGTTAAELRYMSGQPHFHVNALADFAAQVTMPNSGALYYLRGGANATNVSVNGYVVSNGDV